MKLLFIISVLFFSMNLNAQWFNSGATNFNELNGFTNVNELNQDQLNLALQKSCKTIKTGKTLTFVGLAATLVGGVIYLNGMKDIINSSSLSGIDQGVNKGIGGVYVMSGGILLAGVGIPVWIGGANKKDQIEIAMVKFTPTGYINGIGLRIRF